MGFSFNLFKTSRTKPIIQNPTTSIELGFTQLLEPSQPKISNPNNLHWVGVFHSNISNQLFYLCLDTHQCFFFLSFFCSAATAHQSTQKKNQTHQESNLLGFDFLPTVGSASGAIGNHWLVNCFPGLFLLRNWQGGERICHCRHICLRTRHSSHTKRSWGEGQHNRLHHNPTL